MSETIVILSFSNGDKLMLNSKAVINVYNGDNEDVNQPYSSGGETLYPW